MSEQDATVVMSAPEILDLARQNFERDRLIIGHAAALDRFKFVFEQIPYCALRFWDWHSAIVFIKRHETSSSTSRDAGQ
jgi:hypothetical protein